MNRPDLNKSRTFYSNNAPPKPITKTRSLLSRKASSSMDRWGLISLPANQKMEKEQIVHFSHPQHPLAPLNSPYLFCCLGCKEYGAGRRFRCQLCDFDLHEFCALTSPSLQNHPLHLKHQLVFIPKPTGNFRLSTCDVCGKSIKGFAYRCSSCNFEMHPCCAQFEKQMEFPTHGHPLIISKESSHSATDSITVCEECRTKRAGRMYTCSVCDYHIHALCAKDMVNGLYVHGMKTPKKQNKFGAAAKIASHMVLGFLGGLVEGIGEGFGEVLIESLAKGNGRTKSAKTKKT